VQVVSSLVSMRQLSSTLISEIKPETQLFGAVQPALEHMTQREQNVRSALSILLERAANLLPCVAAWRRSLKYSRESFSVAADINQVLCELRQLESNLLASLVECTGQESNNPLLQQVGQQHIVEVDANVQQLLEDLATVRDQARLSRARVLERQENVTRLTAEVEREQQQLQEIDDAQALAAQAALTAHCDSVAPDSADPSGSPGGKAIESLVEGQEMLESALQLRQVLQSNTKAAQFQFRERAAQV